MIVQMDYVTLKTNIPSPPALFCEYMYGFTQNTGKQKEKKKNPKPKKNTSCTHPAAAKPGTTSEGLDPKRRPLIEND